LHISGAYSQKVGRKPFIIIGSVNAGVIAVGSLLVFSNFIDAPLWVLLLSSSIAGITGNIAIAQLTAYSHIGDISEDKSSLAVRLVSN
jgi:MFS family permease